MLRRPLLPAADPPRCGLRHLKPELMPVQVPAGAARTAHRALGTQLLMEPFESSRRNIPVAADALLPLSVAQLLLLLPADPDNMHLGSSARGISINADDCAGADQ